MPELGVETTISRLNQGYVFYKRLLESKNPRSRALGQNVLKKFNSLSNYDVTLGITSQLYTAADVEAAKEVELLNKVFNEKIKFNIKDVRDENFYLNLTNLININLQTKEIFSRYQFRLANYDGAVHVASVYPFYFEKALKRYLSAISKRATAIIMSDDKKDFVEASADAYLEYLPNIIHQSVEEMLKSDDRNGDRPEAERIQGYKEILEAFRNNTLNTKELEKQLLKNYHLDAIADYIKDSEKNTTGKVLSAARLTPEFGKQLQFKPGGVIAEYLEDLVLNSIHSKNKNITIKNFHMGQHGIRPDNMLVLGNPGNTVQTFMSKMKVGLSREEAVEAAIEMSEDLKNFSDTFIVYINDKTAGHSAKFKERGGYKAGESVSLGTFGEVLSHVMEPGLLLGAIGSTIKGGLIDDEEHRDRISDLIAANMAYILFDDITTIGIPREGGQLLHVFDLDGVYIPLSLLMYYLAQAFEKAQHDKKALKKLVNVQIHYTGEAKSILYPDESTDTEETWPIQWDEQKAVAYRDIKIGMYFLSSISDIVKKLNPNYR